MDALPTPMDSRGRDAPQTTVVAAGHGCREFDVCPVYTGDRVSRSGSRLRKHSDSWLALAGDIRQPVVRLVDITTYFSSIVIANSFVAFAPPADG